jgi:putative transposase
MPKRWFSAEQVVTLLRQIEMLIARRKSAPEACRKTRKSQQSYDRWRKENGGLNVD